MQHQLARRFAERLLGKVVAQDLNAPPLSIRDWAKPYVTQGRGFDWIADELSLVLEEDVSRETARRWYYDPEPKRDPKPRRR